jgi:tripartite-type tricarboxylate transporter receptor subunit TctC
MSKLLGKLLCQSILILTSVTSAYAAAPFYEGKTIKLIVGFSAGGGFDTYSRLIARHLGHRIPGNPAIVVENMTGAASLLAANHVYKVAKPDGLTILNFHGNQVVNQVIGKPGIEFDARKFEYIGIPIANGILTTDDEKQAEARLDKGAEAVRAALEMARLRAKVGAWPR